MTWMNKAATGLPVYAARARGARLTDVDGHGYVDFCLGDTAAMAGHSPPPVVAAVTDRLAAGGGLATMLPTEDAAWVGAELARRFGVPRWSFTLTATDANRWAIRLLRAVTGRPRILVNSYCYHGSVDESLIVVGPAIGGGIPIGAYGLSEPLADLLGGRADLDLVDMGGVGGTLAGNPLSLTAARATLEHVLTPSAFAGMTSVATAFADGVRGIVNRAGLPWSVTQLGARVEYRFRTPAPTSGGESAAVAELVG